MLTQIKPRNEIHLKIQLLTLAGELENFLKQKRNHKHVKRA